jgi:GMP synthase PP-ATPase subunit
VTKEQIMRDEALLRERYGNLLTEVAAIMFRHDTEGLAKFGCPNDEYMPEARRVLQKLETVQNADDMRQLVSRVFAEMFEEALDASREQLRALADEVYAHVTANRR